MKASMKIWAHRGCSQKYPENTLVAFSKAIELSKITGIELDIQMTKDGEIVVIHDERVDRTTDAIGYVRDYTYLQLRTFRIETGDTRKEKIPSIVEVLDLIQDRMKEGLLLNIELINNIVAYAGMEDKILNFVAQRGLQDNVIYSSFYTKSLYKIREFSPSTSIGVLDTRVSDCFYKCRGAFGEDISQVALHPYWQGIDLTKRQLHRFAVRVWFTGHLYPEKPTGKKLDLDVLEQQGITDVFLNEPEEYQLY